MSGLAGLRRAETSEGGSLAAAAKQAKDLAGARVAGGVEISLEMLNSVKLKAAAAPKADEEAEKMRQHFLTGADPTSA